MKTGQEFEADRLSIKLSERDEGRISCQPASPAISTNKQSAFNNRICSALRHRTSNSAGQQTSTAKHRARETATFSRFLLNKNSKFRGISSPLEVAIEKKHTAASWPWNLSTVPTRTPAGQRAPAGSDLRVVGRDDHDLLGTSSGAAGPVRPEVLPLQQLLDEPLIASASSPTRACCPRARPART